MNMQLLAWLPGPFEMAVIGVVALLIFGRRLPDVARSFGQSIVEFKKGLRDVKSDIDTKPQIGSSSDDKPDQSSDSSHSSDTPS